MKWYITIPVTSRIPVIDVAIELTLNFFFQSNKKQELPDLKAWFDVFMNGLDKAMEIY